MAGILVYSDKTALALELLSAAAAIAVREGLEIKAVSINNAAQAGELAARGAETYQISALGLLVADTAAVAFCLKQAVDKLGADTVLLSSDRRGKELAGRLAQMLDAGCLTDVKGLEAAGGRTGFVRNALGGATVAVQVLKGPRRVLAVSPGAFSPQEPKAGGSIKELEVETKPSGIKLVETREKAADTVDIASARTLVVVGQGLEDKADLPAAEKLAAVLGGEVACSKPVATDKKWLPEERVIGLSGKICKPDLALILGVSGQVQFTVGIREAKTIVSINSDPNAYMNQMADYVLVADLKDALPDLVRALE